MLKNENFVKCNTKNQRNLETDKNNFQTGFSHKNDYNSRI